MNNKIANSIIPYLETLYELNKNIIKLCGTDVMIKMSESTKTVLDIIQDIPRLIPYENDKRDNVNKLYQRDGLLEYEEEIDYIRNKYECILKNNYDTLEKIRLLRNKYEHKMHGIKETSSGSGTICLFEIIFEIEVTKQTNIEGKIVSEIVIEEKQISAKELISIARELNELFSLLQSEVIEYAYKNGKSGYAVYDRLTRFNLKDFNKIYDSEILREVGMIMTDF